MAAATGVMGEILIMAIIMTATTVNIMMATTTITTTITDPYMPFRAIYRSLETVPSTGNYSRTGTDWRFTSFRRCPDCFDSEISLRSTFAVPSNHASLAAVSVKNPQTAKSNSPAQ